MRFSELLLGSVWGYLKDSSKILAGFLKDSLRILFGIPNVF